MIKDNSHVMFKKVNGRLLNKLFICRKSLFIFIWSSEIVCNIQSGNCLNLCNIISDTCAFTGVDTAVLVDYVSGCGKAYDLTRAVIQSWAYHGYTHMECTWFMYDVAQYMQHSVVRIRPGPKVKQLLHAQLIPA